MSSGNAFIGKPAPDFQATAVMPDGQFKDIRLSDYKGKFVIVIGSGDKDGSSAWLKSVLNAFLKTKLPVILETLN